MTVVADYGGNMKNLAIMYASTEQLRDREWLENVLLRQLGLYPAEAIPPNLWNEGGLGLCQFPNQFAPYLIQLSKLHIKSYAEIGVWVGGTLSVTVEYLSHFGLEHALGIDVLLQTSAIAYAERNPKVELVEASSTSTESAKALVKLKPDLMLIDGDHSEQQCRADWELCRKHAKWVAFHDIVGCPGAVAVWNGIEGKKQEWIEQYDYFPGGHAGLGLVKVA